MRLSRLLSLSLVSLLLSSAIHAARPGYYLGGQLGWGHIQGTGVSDGDMGYMITQALGYSNYTVTSFNGTTSDSGVAWRVFGGYQIGYQWAMEIGWSMYPKLPVDATATGRDLATSQAFSVTTTTGTFKTAAFDFVGKYMYRLPFCCRMNVYGKLGAAYVIGRTTPTVTVSEPGLSAAGEDVIIANRVFPTGSIGLAYDLRNDISMDLSYTRIQKVGHSEQLGSMDAVLLAMSLHFG